MLLFLSFIHVNMQLTVHTHPCSCVARAGNCMSLSFCILLSWKRLQALRIYLSCTLMLGLWAYAAHLASYVGAGIWLMSSFMLVNQALLLTEVFVSDWLSVLFLLANFWQGSLGEEVFIWTSDGNCLCLWQCECEAPEYKWMDQEWERAQWMLVLSWLSVFSECPLPTDLTLSVSTFTDQPKVVPHWCPRAS